MRHLNASGVIAYQTNIIRTDALRLQLTGKRQQVTDLDLPEEKMGRLLDARSNAIEYMRRYARQWQCRQQTLLAFFGEESGPCGNCDVCSTKEVLID